MESSYKNKQIIIGLGTGRCGTLSLSKLLDGCSNLHSIHEKEMDILLPWVFNGKSFARKVVQLKAPTKSIAEIAFFYLPYTSFLKQEFPNIKFICLRRNKSQTIDSFMETTGTDNHWAFPENKEWTRNSRWDQCFPKYQDTYTKQECITRYYDEYYDMAKRYEILFPKNFKIFDINLLNTKEGQKEIFDFVGIPEKDRVFTDRCKFNER